MSKMKRTAGWLIAPVCLVLVLGMALAGCGGGGDGSIQDILKKSVDAQQAISSYHSELRWDYVNSPYGTGTREAWVIDVSGQNFHINVLQFGMVSKMEVVNLNGQVYVKTIANDEWQKASGTAAPAVPQRQEATKLLDWEKNSIKQTNLGEENVKGYQCYHIQFELSAENVRNMATQVSSSELKDCTGGTADFWISTDKYWLIQSELLVKNATDPVIGRTDIKLLNSYSQVNQPVTITAPI